MQAEAWFLSGFLSLGKDIKRFLKVVVEVKSAVRTRGQDRLRLSGINYVMSANNRLTKT